MLFRLHERDTSRSPKLRYRNRDKFCTWCATWLVYRLTWAYLSSSCRKWLKVLNIVYPQDIILMALKETHHRRQHLLWWILCKRFVEGQTKDNNRCDHQQDTHQDANGKPHVKQIRMELSKLDKGPVEAHGVPPHLAYWKRNAIIFQKLLVSPRVFSIILKTRRKKNRPTLSSAEVFSC